jgi:hypothetical protein
MAGTKYVLLIDLACTAAAALVLLPVIIYLLTDWKTRRDKLFAYFDDCTLHLYYEQFSPSTRIDGDIHRFFQEQFDRLYGRRLYLAPLILLGLVTVASGWGIARTIQHWEQVGPLEFEMPTVVVSALAGAFAWVVTDQLDRFRKRNFTTTDIYNCAFRFIVAIPLAFSLAAFAKDEIGVPLAFVLGAFPTATLFTIARRLGAQKLGVGDSQESSGNLELEKLQCIGKSNAERFQDVGITTIAELAWSDPVELTIRTNFDFNYVIDCTSQALLWLYFEDKTKGLYVLSLRGAQEVCALLGCAPDSPERRHCERAIEESAKILNLDPVALMATLQQVANDPYTKFIMRVWH